MRKRTFAILCAVITLVGVLSRGAVVFAGDNAPEVQQPASVLDLGELISEALQANPDIAAAQRRRDALWERSPQAKAWDDPRLSFGVRNLPTDDGDFNKIDMTMKEVSLSQVIPLPGITSLREKAAIQEAKSADRMHDYTRLQVIRAVKKAYFELYLLSRHINTAEKNRDLLDQFAEIARSNYIVGNGLLQDVLKAQIEHDRFIERLIQFKQQSSTVTAELNRLLAREVTTPLLGVPVLPQHRITLSEEELYAAAVAGNPALLSLQEIIARNEASYELAKKSYVPEIMITGAYGQREDKDRFTNRSDVATLLVGLNVPIWFKSKQNRKVAETYFMVEQAQAEYKAMANEIRYKIRDILAKQAREIELIGLYENSIIPQAAQSLESSVAAYQVGVIDFLTLIDSQVTLCNAELQVASAQAQYQMNMAELEALVGNEQL